MTEQETMDRLLRESMTVSAVPTLSSTFDRGLTARLRPRRLSTRSRLAIGLYVPTAIFVSVATMRSVSIDWIPTGLAVLLPVLIVFGTMGFPRVAKRPGASR